MGQEVKNLLRAQSNYGLMGSSAKTGKKNFDGSQEQFLDKTVIWDRTPPPPICKMQCICVGEGSRVPNLQTEFNYLDLFKSYGIFSDFVVPVVPTLSLSSLRHPRHPHVVPVSSLSSPRHPHSPQKVPMVCGLRGLCGLHMSPPMLSPPMLSPPMLSLSSPHRPRHPHIVPTSSRRSPDHSHPPDSHPTHPTPLGGGGPRITKNTWVDGWANEWGQVKSLKIK